MPIQLIESLTANVSNLETIPTLISGRHNNMTNLVNGSPNQTLLDVNKAIGCSLSYPECEAARYLWMIVSPLLLLMGTVGNVLVITMMLRKPLRLTAFGNYLLFIAFTDTLGLWSGLLRQFIKVTFLYDVREYSPLVCQAQRFFLYGSIDSSVWLLMAVSLERTLSIFFPMKAVVMKKLTHTRIFIFCILLLQYGWNAHVFFTRGREVKGTQVKNCGYPKPEYMKYWTDYHFYIALVIYSVLPFIVMIITNVAIFMKLKQRDDNYKEVASVNKGVIHTIFKKSQKLSAASKNQTTTSSQSRASQKTRMLLPVTVFFLITTLPTLAYSVVEQKVVFTGSTQATMILVDVVFTSLMYLNHSTNFFLYCLSGKTFREQCKNLLLRKCCCKKIDSSSGEQNYSRSPLMEQKKVSRANVVQVSELVNIESGSHNAEVDHNSNTALKKERI